MFTDPLRFAYWGSTDIYVHERPFKSNCLYKIIFTVCNENFNIVIHPPSHHTILYTLTNVTTRKGHHILGDDVFLLKSQQTLSHLVDVAFVGKNGVFHLVASRCM